MANLDLARVLGLVQERANIAARSGLIDVELDGIKGIVPMNPIVGSISLFQVVKGVKIVMVDIQNRRLQRAEFEFVDFEFGVFVKGGNDARWRSFENTGVIPDDHGVWSENVCFLDNEEGRLSAIRWLRAADLPELVAQMEGYIIRERSGEVDVEVGGWPWL